jgi:hypothetical protein
MTLRRRERGGVRGRFTAAEWKVINMPRMLFLALVRSMDRA